MGKVISEAKTFTGRINKLIFTDSYDQKIELSETRTSAVGTQEDVVYIRTPSSFAIYKNGEQIDSGPGQDGETLFTIDSTGDAVFFGDVTAFYSSDVRLKKNINKLENVLDRISKLQPVRYEFIKEKKFDKRKEHLGIIAQELMEHFPELVIQRSDGFYAVEYDKIVVILLQAIKELQDIINKKET